MANKSGWIKRYVMSFSFNERRNRELSNYKKRVLDLKNMEPDELDFEYVALKSEYGQKKSVLTIFIISIALSILMNVWKYFFIFIEKALQYAASFESGSKETVKLSFVIISFMAVLITFVILFILITYMKEIYKIQKELLIVEVVRNTAYVKGVT